MLQIGDAYLHVQYTQITDEQFYAMTRKIESSIIGATQIFYKENVDIDILVEDQTFLTKVAIIGGLIFGAYNMVVNYSEFKQEIEQLYEDLVKFGDTVCENIMEIIGAKQSDVIYRRIRSRDMNRLKRISDNIKAMAELSNQELRDMKIVDRIKWDLIKLYDKGMARDNVQNIINMIPKRSEFELPNDVENLINTKERLSGHDYGIQRTREIRKQEVGKALSAVRRQGRHQYHKRTSI